MNANTTMDRTVYFNAFPPNQLNKWLELYSHRFMKPVFRLFQSELEVVYEEKNLYNDNFITAIFENFAKKFYKTHPYGQQTTIGTVEHLKNPSLTKMYNFFKTYYVANNMALVLSGDFNTDEAKKLINEKFSQIPSGKIPEFAEFKENEFAGREEITMKLSPIKIGLYGFRAPKSGHEDEIAFEICNAILSNQDQTGLFDQLMLDNKLLAAQVFNIPGTDYSASIILSVPKILGQSLESAETLLMTELHKLSAGEFDETLLNNAKLNLNKQFQQQLESNESRAVLIAEVFTQNKDVNSISELVEKVKKVTKDDIINIAKKYYGNNYLAFQSKMGFPKKNKLEKPDYKPVAPKKDAKSPYLEQFEKITANKPITHFVDFEKDLSYSKLKENVDLYVVKNPINEIFSIKFKFGLGMYNNPSLAYAAQLMNFAGSYHYTLKNLKTAFSNLGCSYSISCDDSYVYVELTGFDNKLKESLELIKELFVAPNVDKDKLSVIINGEQSTRKMESSEPDNVARALFNYVRFGDKSEYLNRLTIKEIKKLNTDTLITEFLNALKYDVTIHYTGNSDIGNLKNYLLNCLDLGYDFKKGNSPIVKIPIEYNKSKIYFVDKKNALQSKIYLFTNGENYDLTQSPYINAFNQYFSGDFSGLVLQEIREYRSLAYGAGAGYVTPELPGIKASFYGYVGTQDDKSIEAIEVFTNLIKTMPEKPERIDNIKVFLEEASAVSYPFFRDLSETVESWKRKGYTEDPSIKRIEVYKKLTFNDITDFYKKNIQPKSIVYSIVGDKKRIDMNVLAKYGEIIFVKQNNLFK
ncbi:MAG: hypothetical protein A2046_13480 [Bacteroidetes bacterium GWA2_30_7]|nr:MAG: hypothetical protein A2046_13480 [Bacteroidetes bacterium GWA2_30_7]